MRKVFDAQQVCHLWANQSQDEARTAGQNLYFTGATLVSYGDHYVIGHFLDDGRVLMNDASYSMTTSKHSGYAWQALSGRQRAEGRVLRMPSMGTQTVREIESCRSGRYAEQRRDVTALMTLRTAVTDAMQTIAASSRKAPTAKMERAYAEARTYDATARALVAYMAEGYKGKAKRNAPAWELPELPATLPADKAERDALCVSVARGQMLERAARDMEQARALAEQVRAVLASDAGALYLAQYERAAGTIAQAEAHLKAANATHEQATGKWPRGAVALGRDIARMTDEVKPRYRAEWVSSARGRLLGAVREVASLTHRIGIAARGASARELEMHAYAVRQRGRWASAQFTQIAGELQRAAEWGAPELQAEHAAWVARLQRIAEWTEWEQASERAHAQFTSARSYMEGVKANSGNPAGARIYAADVVREWERGARAVESIAAKARPEFVARHLQALREAMAEHAGFVAEWKADEAKRNAQAVAAWMAGESNNLPASAGTLARIKGQEVQTSRGARVPLTHACRLARIARRVIAQGGREWEHGAGPQVGGFRVVSIGADGRTVIGCHEFEPAEALRMLDVLQAACVDCATEDDGAELQAA